MKNLGRLPSSTLSGFKQIIFKQKGTSIKDGLDEKGFDRCNVKVAHSIMIVGASVAIRSL